MSLLSIKLKDPIVEDYLRIHFDSWNAEAVQISAGDFLGDLILSFAMSKYAKPTPGNLLLALPTHELFRHDRYPYQYLTRTRTLALESICIGLYQTMVNRWVWTGMVRGLNRKQSILLFLDHYQALAGDRELRINYAAIEKMIIRDTRRVAEVFREANNLAKYKTVM